MTRRHSSFLPICACSICANSSIIGCFSYSLDRLATARERTSSLHKHTLLTRSYDKYNNIYKYLSSVLIQVCVSVLVYLSPVSTRAYAEFSDLKDRYDTETVLKTEAEHYASKVGGQGLT